MLSLLIAQGRKGKYTAEEKAAMEAEKQLKRRQKEEMRRKRPENCLKVYTNLILPFYI